MNGHMHREIPDAQKPFHDWVKKWDIGPGMNDCWLGRGEPPLDYKPPQNYTGRDGTVGPGWVPILDRLAADLIALGWDRSLRQVKEKFGTLRFYIDAGNDKIYDRISQAEAESARTCEFCGAPAKLRGIGWVVTLCVPCARERGVAIVCDNCGLEETKHVEGKCLFEATDINLGEPSAGTADQ